MQKVNTIETRYQSNQETTSNQSATEQMERTTSIQPTIAPIKIDVMKFLEHGDTSAAIILSIAVFTAVLLRSGK